jgi:hypothetical protein
LQSGIVVIYSFVEPTDKSKTDVCYSELKEISIPVWPFDASTVSLLQENVDERYDYVEPPSGFGHKLNDIFYLSACERRFMFESGCIDSLDAEVLDWDLERWHPQAEAHFVRRIEEYLKATNQPPLR